MILCKPLPLSDPRRSDPDDLVHGSLWARIKVECWNRKNQKHPLPGKSWGKTVSWTGDRPVPFSAYRPRSRPRAGQAGNGTI